jgi:ribosome-associated heat shock protein Hsp15
MGRHGQDDEPAPLTEVRLDVWLDVACLFPTRSQAAAACAGGKVDVNGHAASAHRKVRAGDRLAITFARGKRTFAVKGLLERHVKKSEAHALYEETTPPLAPEILEARRLERLLAPRRDEKSGKLSKKDRRDLEKTRGW